MVEPDPNIAGWSKRKLIEFIRDELGEKQTDAGCVSFMLTFDFDSLGWLNQSGRTLTFSNQGVDGGDESVVIDAVVGGDIVTAPFQVPPGELVSVQATNLQEGDTIYVSYQVK